MLVHALADEPPPQRLALVVLVAAPFVGEGGWPSGELTTPADLGARLPRGVPVHVFHGVADETAPPAHADLYARVMPAATVHRVPGADHQLNEDLTEVARVIQELRKG
jgi:pimeloyl-ACP methyl ester carboxylesterase